MASTAKIGQPQAATRMKGMSDITVSMMLLKGGMWCVSRFAAATTWFAMRK